jgi:hypothetical protein
MIVTLLIASLATAYNVRQGPLGYQEKCSDIRGLVIRSAHPTYVST